MLSSARASIWIACPRCIAEVGAMKDTSFDELVRSIAACRTVITVAEKFRREIARYGYSSSSCVVFAPGNTNSVTHFLFRNWSREWAGMLDNPDFPAISYDTSRATLIIAEARRRIASFAWTDVRKDRMLSEAERITLDAMLTYGWADGFVTPIHGPAGYLALVTTASTERNLDLSPKRRLLLQAIATLAHERSRAVAKLAAIEPLIDIDAITPRERECLRLVADGNTDREIADLLSISPTTAKYYIDAARTKLGAKTRAQAVARMVRSGLY